MKEKMKINKENACILILIGIFALGNPTNFKTITIIILFVILGGAKGAHNVLIYRYLNNFTNREIRTKVSTLRNVVYNLFTIGISLFGASYQPALLFILPPGAFLTLGFLLAGFNKLKNKKA